MISRIQIPWAFQLIKFGAMNKRFQRNAISRGLVKLANNDIVLISDLDEIPDPYTLAKMRSGEIVVDLNSLDDRISYSHGFTVVCNWQQKHFPIIDHFFCYVKNKIQIKLRKHGYF